MEAATVTTKKVGLFSIQDTGAPNGSDDYKTLVVFHGFGWHRGVFSRFLPLAALHNARVVLVNRRDYPDSIPLDESDLRPLTSAESNTLKPAANVRLYMKARAYEVYNFLVEFVSEECIMVDSLVLAAWSFGCAFVLGLLAHVSTFPVSDVQLEKYIRRIILYEPPYHVLGYDPPSDSYNPLYDISLTPEEGAKAFPAWVSGYYAHGGSASSLEHCIALVTPRPTILAMSSEDIHSALYPPCSAPGGSDYILKQMGIRHGLYADLRRGALYFANRQLERTSVSEEGSCSEEEGGSDWRNVELRYISCDQSVWEIPWGKYTLQEELVQAEKEGRKMRKVDFVRMKRANHFAHWDHPERTLRALLSDNAGEA